MNGTVSSRALAIGVLVVLFLAIIYILALFQEDFSSGGRENYSVGYEIGPEYLDGNPYVMSETCPGLGPSLGTFESQLKRERMVSGSEGSSEGTNLVYNPPITQNLRGNFPNWWTPDNGTYGLPPASERPDFWAGDMTIHTYKARDPIPPLCGPKAGSRRTCAQEIDEWRYYGGPKGWTYSPYY